MKYEISETSRLWLSGNTATLLVLNSVQKIVWGWFAMIIGIIMVVVCCFFEPNVGLVLAGAVLFLYGFISFAYKEFVVIDAKRKRIERKSNILHVCINRKVLFWEQQSELKYNISFNSLERISFISLAIYSKKEDTYTFIMDFPEAKAFFAFQQIFNKRFPEYQISETAKSRIEFNAAEEHRKQIRSSHNRVLRHKDHLI